MILKVLKLLLKEENRNRPLPEVHLLQLKAPQLLTAGGLPRVMNQSLVQLNPPLPEKDQDEDKEKEI